MEDHKNVYREEAQELLAELEAALLELEESPRDAELIGQIFRSMHTIKGSGAMFGFDNVAEFTHEIETVFDMVRDGKVPVSRKLIEQTLSACDMIKAMVEERPVDPEAERSLVARFQRIVSPQDGVDGVETVSETEGPSQGDSDGRPSSGEGEDATYRIRFRPHGDLFSTGTNPILLIQELGAFGECHVALFRRDLPRLEAMDPEKCYFYWDIYVSTWESVAALRDVFIFVEDHCELRIEVIDSVDIPQLKAAEKRLGEILVERGDVSSDVVERVLEGKKRIGEILLERAAIDQETLDAALIEQNHIRKRRGRKQEAVVFASSIRVAAEKLDRLVDLVGELVTVQARLTRKAAIADDADLTAVAEEVERLSAELRDNTMNIRMLPVGSTFRKFKRLVHDLCAELGKEAVIVTEGEETELDKTVLEQLNDPLVHIIRNTIDHGIERPEVRENRGKPREGVIRLSAEHSGSGVQIRISDDGAGIDVRAVRAKAVEKGLIKPEDDLSAAECLDLIFMPGFSTAGKVSGVSGRGVGMDVVKRKVEDLRGRVELESKKGIGTTVSLQLPLTLAITDGLLVNVGESHYVLPLLSVEECLELSRKDADKARERNILNCRGQVISYISLRELFGTEGDPPELEKVVVVQSNGDRIGLGVDRVVGQLQTVIKGLGRFYRDIKRISGATILGDGNVALILDVAQIIRSSREEGASTMG